MPKDQDVRSVAESKPHGVKSVLWRTAARFCSLMVYATGDVCLYGLVYAPDDFSEDSLDQRPPNAAQVDVIKQTATLQATDGDIETLR
jgi:hypothetical protein